MSTKVYVRVIRTDVPSILISDLDSTLHRSINSAPGNARYVSAFKNADGAIEAFVAATRATLSSSSSATFNLANKALVFTTNRATFTVSFAGGDTALSAATIASRINASSGNYDWTTLTSYITASSSGNVLTVKTTEYGATAHMTLTGNARTTLGLSASTTYGTDADKAIEFQDTGDFRLSYHQGVLSQLRSSHYNYLGSEGAAIQVLWPSGSSYSI